MWKVEITKIHKLYEFTEVFLLDLFNWAIQNKDISRENMQESIKENRLYFFAKECSSLREHMYKLANSSEIDKVFKIYNEYIENYEMVVKGRFQSNISLESDTREVVQDAFEYFYKEGLDLKSFWNNYNSGEYKSKNDYRTQLGYIRHRCPYCDINRTTVADFSNTDHFLPISTYPFVGILWKNLIVSCMACNTSIKGKEITFPILHPFFDEIHEELFFTFDFEKKSISINAKDNGFGKDAAENFYKLFHLERNYPELWDVIEREEMDIVRETSRCIKKHKITEMEKGLQEVKEIIDDRKSSIYSQRTIGECTKLKLDFYNNYRQYIELKIKKILLLEKHGMDVFKQQEVNKS